MRARDRTGWIVGACLTLAGCDAREAQSPAPLAITLTPPPLLSAEPSAKPTAPRQVRTIRCEIVSEDLPADRCVRYVREVLDTRGKPLAKLSGAKIKTTLDLEPLPRALRVVAESEKLVVRGELARESTWLYLTEPTHALSSHLTFWRGAPVRPIRLGETGVVVSAFVGFNGIAEVDTEVACGKLSFGDIDPVHPDPTPGMTKDVYVPIGAITLHDKPGGRVLGTIGTGHFQSNGAPPTNTLHVGFPANLVLLEQETRFSRFAFDATFARFDVWIPNAEVKVGTGQGFGGGRGCSSSRRSGKGMRATVDVPTRLALGATSDQTEEVDVTLKPGAEVVKLESGNGLSRVYVVDDAIEVPEGRSFFARESALRVIPSP